MEREDAGGSPDRIDVTAPVHSNSTERIARRAAHTVGPLPAAVRAEAEQQRIASRCAAICVPVEAAGRLARD
eukprot:7360571-Prymnesium_polylepis.2